MAKILVQYFFVLGKKNSIATSLLVNIGKATLTTVVPIKMISHESTSTTLSIRTLFPQPLDFAAIINLVELEYSELDLVLNLGFDIVNSVRGLNLEGYCLARQGFHEDLHLRFFAFRDAEQMRKIYD
ncbi:hypothetical protein OIU76_022486 [Salix suchowensis]|nr:hypothetical protein OIU76_022486 [Salix suchowensis]